MTFFFFSTGYNLEEQHVYEIRLIVAMQDISIALCSTQGVEINWCCILCIHMHCDDRYNSPVIKGSARLHHSLCSKVASIHLWRWIKGMFALYTDAAILQSRHFVAVTQILLEMYTVECNTQQIQCLHIHTQQTESQETCFSNKEREREVERQKSTCILYLKCIHSIYV